MKLNKLINSQKVRRQTTLLQHFSPPLALSLICFVAQLVYILQSCWVVKHLLCMVNWCLDVDAAADAKSALFESTSILHRHRRLLLLKQYWTKIWNKSLAHTTLPRYFTCNNVVSTGWSRASPIHFDLKIFRNTFECCFYICPFYAPNFHNALELKCVLCHLKIYWCWA